jgi:hypothetical protein
MGASGAKLRETWRTPKFVPKPKALDVYVRLENSAYEANQPIGPHFQPTNVAESAAHQAGGSSSTRGKGRFVRSERSTGQSSEK